MKVFYIMGLLAMSLLLGACEKKDIGAYDAGKSYIYIDVPYKLDGYGQATEIREDSISYSFALDAQTVEDTVIKVVVKTIGMPANEDRVYSIEMLPEETTATSAEWDSGILENRCIKAGQITDTLCIRINRSDNLRKQWMQIGLRVVSNEYFEAGYANLQKAKVSFSDILAEPDWWSDWKRVFGTYYREIYQQWIVMYPLGADPTISYQNGEPYYWNNMPRGRFIDEESYPITFSYVSMLGEYFKKNEVYPNGDTSKPRIVIPYTNY